MICGNCISLRALGAKFTFIKWLFCRSSMLTIIPMIEVIMVIVSHGPFAAYGASPLAVRS